jgi:hypothetical protein
MDTSYSIAPPPPPAAVVRPQPVGDLKRLDGKRVLARITDAVVLLPVSIVMASTEDAALWVPMLLATLIYFFLCKVSGKRRQRIGDMLAGTTVGAAVKPVPKPASSPLLVIYPVGWLIAAIVWFTGTSGVRTEAEYLGQANAICARTADHWVPDITTSRWLAVLQAQQLEHAALRPPDSLEPLHAELLAIGRADIGLGHRFMAAERRGDAAAYARIEKRANALDERREKLGAAGLDACG